MGRTTRPNLLLISSVAVSAVILAACGGSASGGATGSGSATRGASSPAGVAGTPTSTAAAVGTVPADPCTLITPQEASAALGVDAGTPSGNSAQCAYSTPTGAISVTDTQYPSGSTADASYTSTRGAAMGGVPGFQDVSGIGNRAFVTSSGLMGFEKGSTVVLIQVLSSGDTTAATMTSLGQAAAGRV
jgi:hypothetical protein